MTYSYAEQYSPEYLQRCHQQLTDRVRATRWLSKYKVMKQLMDLFGDVEPFLEEVSVSPVTVEKLLSILRNPREEASLDGISSNN